MLTGILQISEQHPVDELKELVEEAEKETDRSLFDDPRFILILPDFISINNVEELFSRWSKTHVLSVVRLTTIEDLAEDIVGKVTNIRTLLPTEIRKLVLVECLREVAEAKRTKALASKIWSLVKDRPHPDTEDVMFQLNEELDEFLRCVSPRPNILDPFGHFVLMKKEIERIPDKLMRDSVLSILEFYADLMVRVDKKLEDWDIPGFFSRAHLVAEATCNLQKGGAGLQIKGPESARIWISGIANFDATTLEFVIQLCRIFNGVRINTSPLIADRLRKRIKNTAPDIRIDNVGNGRCKPALEDANRIEAPDMRREIVAVAAEISKMIHEDDIQPKDVVVICRDSGRYMPFVENSLRELGLPSYVQTRRRLSLTPSFKLVLSLLDLLVAVERSDKIPPKLITDPFRLGFTPSPRDKPAGDREFLRLEAMAARISGNKDMDWDEWRSRIEGLRDGSRRYFEKLVAWIEEQRKKVEKDEPHEEYIRSLENVLVNFRTGCSDWKSELAIEDGYDGNRFKICGEHITANAGRLYNGLDRLGHYVRIMKRIRSRKSLDAEKSLPKWTDIRGGFLAVAGSYTYGVPQRDANAVKFVDAGLSHFIEARARFIVGLRAESFPRVCPSPFLIPDDYRRIVNESRTVLYFRDPETDFETEADLFTVASGPIKRDVRITLTMPYLDERGHKENWSIFAIGGKDPIKIGASEIVNEQAVAFSPCEYWRKGSQTVRGQNDLAKHFTDIMSQEWRTVYDTELTPRFLALEERVIKGAGPEKIDIRLEPYLATYVEALKREPIPSHEIDLYSYCPSMHYFYRYLYALGPYSRKDKKGDRTYVPEWKNDFSLGPVPLPLRRMTISSELASFLAKLLELCSTSEELRANMDGLIREIYAAEGLEFSSKIFLRNCLSFIIKNLGSSKVGYEHGKQSGGDEQLWRPFLLKLPNAEGGTNLFHLAKFSPPENSGRTDNKIWLRVSCLHNRFGKSVVCPSSGRFYTEMNNDIFSSSKNAIINMHYPDPTRDERCEYCVYMTLCGNWRFS